MCVGRAFTLHVTSDVLHVSAAGATGQVAAFSASVAGVALPNATMPASLARDPALEISWTPDANATSMTLTLASYAQDGAAHGTITCHVSEAVGTVSVAPTLLARFDSGDRCWGYLVRSASTNVNVERGSVT
jgi:hypothetical protein